eukprot:1393402-Amorphochlora_amoeboformis.AAC.1
MAADGKGIAFPSLGAREGEPLKNLPLAKMIKPSKNAWGNRKKTRMLSTALANAEKRDDGVLKVKQTMSYFVFRGDKWGRVGKLQRGGSCVSSFGPIYIFWFEKYGFVGSEFEG